MLDDFRAGRIRTLVTTELLGMIDVDDVNVVINYDLPMQQEYTKRKFLIRR